MSVVVFDPAGFVARYPEFECVSASLLNSFFNEAGMYCNNTDSSPVRDLTQRTYFLWLLTAHISALSGQPNGLVKPVGRVSDVTEGSVDVSIDYLKMTPGSGPWFNQTQYGAAFWQASSSYRSFKYRVRQTVPL